MAARKPKHDHCSESDDGVPCPGGPPYPRGLCRKHYQRAVKTGTLPLTETELAGETRPDCKVETCADAAVALGMCQKHYGRHRRWGSPHIVHTRGQGPSAVHASPEDSRTAVVFPIVSTRETLGTILDRAGGTLDLRLARQGRRPIPGDTPVLSVIPGDNRPGSGGAAWVVLCKVHTESIPTRSYHRR